MGRLRREKLLDLVADIDHVQLQVAVGAIVKSVGTAALEVNESADLLGMTAADRTQLFAGNRVPDKDWLVQMKGGDDGKDIVAETVGRIIVVDWEWDRWTRQSRGG